MKTVLIDFDGVLHSYSSGWQGASSIPDSPNPGAIEFLQRLIDDPDIEPIIWTSRVHCKENEDPADSENAKTAIRQWLYLQGLRPDDVQQLKVTNEKPPAVLLIDDRAYNFSGLFPTLEFIHNFTPWKAGDGVVPTGVRD